MRTSKILCIVFVIFNLVSCQTANNNIELTDFTRELIYLYINHPDNLARVNEGDNIILISTTSNEYYCLSVGFLPHSVCIFCQFRNESFVGQASYLGHSIKVFGNENPIFYTVTDEVRTQQKCEGDVHEILLGGNTWRFCLHYDMSFCKMRTRKDMTHNISAMQNLAKRHFRVLDTIHPMHENEVFEVGLLDFENWPRFPFGDDSLARFIISNFEVKRGAMHPQHGIATIVTILVDKNGNTTVVGIGRSSNDVEFDNEALRVAEMIVSQHEFIPGILRGHNVSTRSSIVFAWQWAELDGVFPN